MPAYRFMIEGKDEDSSPDAFTDGSSIGFFTTRVADGRTLAKAQNSVLATLREEWSSGVSARLFSGKRLKLIVVDAWPVGLWNRYRGANGGHTFFGESSIAEAAKLEATVAKAPRSAAIWKIAAS